MTTMSAGTARKALYQMFKDAWDATDGWMAILPAEPPVFYDNVRANDAPESSKVKIEVNVHHTEKPMMTFGQGRPNYKAIGTVVVRISVPKDAGLTLADALGNIVKRAFQAKRGSGASDSLVLRGTVTSEEGATDRWFVVRAYTPFEYEDED